MKAWMIFFWILIFGNSIVKAQDILDFGEYATKQNSLMTISYQKRDTANYRNLLSAFLENYYKLDKKDQLVYKYHLQTAYYDFACAYALTGNKLKALEYLEKSKFTDYNHLLSDTDLDNIRNEKRFEICLKYAKENTPNFLAILKKASKYSNRDKNYAIDFTYQSAENENLKLLRSTYNLDSIAGTGNEVSKILNLLHWMHYLIPHNGSNGNPEMKNALSFIQVCKNEHRGLNCRGLAIALNECYLALNIKSRFITCMPKDSTDSECHVINMVFSNTLQKWLWIDPTFDSYVMNEKGELLSIQEVRERVINGKQVIINPDANWNREQSQNIGNYLYNYMSKNLYYFVCSVNSHFDLETESKDRKQYIALIPDDYYSYMPKEMKYNSSINNKEVKYINNPDIFWSKPK
jgi:hypothetical protein